MTDILCLGEAMVEFVRQPDGRTYVQGFGGDTSNAAIAAARQGAKAGYATAVGDDPFGRDLRDLWRREGVDTSCVQISRDAPTGIYFVDPDPAARHFTYYREGSAASRMTPGALSRATLEGVRVLHISGITLAVSKALRETAFSAARTVKDLGGRVSLDTNLRLKLWSREEARETLDRATELADIVFTSIDDQETLSGATRPDRIVSAIRSRGPGLVACTRGGDGVFLSTPEGEVEIPAAPADPVDSTGAGDCFAGAFLARWLETGDPLLAARAATIAAAATVSAMGAIEAIPDRRTVDARAAELGWTITS